MGRWTRATLRPLPRPPPQPARSAFAFSSWLVERVKVERLVLNEKKREGFGLLLPYLPASLLWYGWRTPRKPGPRGDTARDTLLVLRLVERCQSD
jgi:hypothetical protein